MNKTFYKWPSEGHKLIAANSSTFLLSAEKRGIFNWVLRLDQKIIDTSEENQRRFQHPHADPF